MPPVLAPSLMTRPRPQPMHRPPKSAHRKGSVVSTVSPSRPWTQPSNEGYAMVLASVLRANVLPSATRPTANMTRLNAPTKGARGMPAACCTARPMPVVPPVTRSPGTTNTATPRAYTKLPKMIQAKRETTCLQVLVTRCSFSPTSSSFIKKSTPARFSLTDVDRGVGLIQMVPIALSARRSIACQASFLAR